MDPSTIPMKHLTRFLLAVILCSCARQPTPMPQREPVSANSRIAPGDVIRVAFSGSPEMNDNHKIQPDGLVSLPQIGATPAAGTTLAEFQSRLNHLYQPWLQEPGVVVTMQNSASGIYVGGEVMRPGKIPLDRPMTALQAIMEAGGFTRLANPGKVVLVRQSNGLESRQILDLNRCLESPNSAAIFLRADDVIYVRPSFW